MLKFQVILIHYEILFNDQISFNETNTPMLLYNLLS